MKKQLHNLIFWMTAAGCMLSIPATFIGVPVALGYLLDGVAATQERGDYL